MLLVSCCNVRFDFRVKTMFMLSLRSSVLKRICVFYYVNCFLFYIYWFQTRFHIRWCSVTHWVSIVDQELLLFVVLVLFGLLIFSALSYIGLWSFFFCHCIVYPFFRNACTKSGSLRFSQFSGCWLILSVYILMSFDFPFVRLFGVR